MDWIYNYRLCNTIDSKILRFIENCDEDNFLHKSEKITYRRENRIKYLIENEVCDSIIDPLCYLNVFLDDFKDHINFLEAPVGQYMYYCFLTHKPGPFQVNDSKVDNPELYSNRVSLNTRSISVSSYEFDDYSQMKEFLLSSIESKNKIYVFTYRVNTKTEIYSLGTFHKKKYHVLRCFMVSDDDIKTWVKEWNGVYEV